MTLMLAVLMWFIPRVTVDVNFAPGMDVRDRHLIEHWQIPAAPLFCGFQHFKVAVSLPHHKQGAFVQSVETAFQFKTLPC